MTDPCSKFKMNHRDRPQSAVAETLNFWLTNRLPRNFLTYCMGWFSRIESPWLARLSIAVWQRFVDDLRLHEAEQESFDSLHACFVRRLKPGSRPLNADLDVLVSPCDAEIGAMGEVRNCRLFQAKGLAYELADLLSDPTLALDYAAGVYVTLRLKSSMYHRFHAPADCRLETLSYISGERFNVNPPTLARLPGVFVRNERAVLPLDVDGLGQAVMLVPVAAILVASIRLHGLEASLNRHDTGADRFTVGRRYARGEEIGWFEHGSTIIVLARSGLRLHPTLASGRIIRMGEALLYHTNSTTPKPGVRNPEILESA